MGQIKALSMLEKETSSQIISEYFQWLCEIVHVDSGDTSYWLLAKALHKKEFFWTVPNDDNRGSDGKKLREQFAEEADISIEELFNGGPCSMLEMLISLAKRIEDALCDTDEGDRTSKWFWEILSNLGLDVYKDEVYYELYGNEYIDSILNNVLERTYKRSGKGGLFPLKHPKKDQRKVEIWYQMSAYLLENYYVDGEFV